MRRSIDSRTRRSLSVAAAVLALAAGVGIVLAGTTHRGGEHAKVGSGVARHHDRVGATAAATPSITGFGGAGSDLWVTTSGGGLWLSWNGGATWNSTDPPVPLAGDGTRRLAVAQSGAGAVWLVAPTAKQMTEDLFVSGDGGRSWSAPLPVPSSSHQTFARDGVAPDEVSVQLLSPEVGAVVLDQFWMGTDGTGTLDVSTDGGKTFTVDRLPTWGPVRFSSQSRGYLSATGRLYETTDGGADWRELEAPAPTSSSTASVKRITTVGFPIASSTGGMVVPVTVTTTTLASRTSETELLLMPLPAGGSGGAIGQPVGRPLSSDSELLVARGSGTGRLLVAQSDGSHVYSSTDTGETWASAVPTGLPAQWGLADVVLTTSGSAVALAVHQDCPGKQHCTSGAALYTTHDDGASWTLLDPLGDALAS